MSRNWPRPSANRYPDQSKSVPNPGLASPFPLADVHTTVTIDGSRPMASGSTLAISNEIKTAPPHSDKPVIWINRAMESLWLLAVIFVPLVFLGRDFGEWSSVIGSFEIPKLALLRILVGILFSLWLLKLVIENQGPYSAVVKLGTTLAHPTGLPGNFNGWLRRQPARWLFLAAFLYLATTLLSTVFSASFSVSMWGDVPGQDSYSAYTVLAYVLLFGIVATHLRTADQMKRLLGAILIMAVVVAGYSIFQNYGNDFLDLREPINTNRSSSTLGNPIFAASLLLKAIPICLASATMTKGFPTQRLVFWGKLGFWIFVLTILLLGMLFTLSRGPWFGTAVALGLFLGGLALLVGLRQSAHAALVLGAAVLISVLVLQIPSSREVESEVVPSASQAVTTRVTNTAASVGAAGLEGRLRIWRASRRLVSNHPWYGFDALSVSSLRPLIGYGPELFRSAYLLESEPVTVALLPGEAAHAHNFFIHQTVEQGFLGLITATGIYLVPIFTGIFLLNRRRYLFSTFSKLLLIALLAVFTGRFLEQLVGIARVSDLTLFWVLLAAFAVIASYREGFADASAPAEDSGHPRESSPPAREHVVPRQRHSFERAAMLVAVACLIGGVATLTWFKSINNVRAAVSADNAAAQFRTGNLSSSLQAIDRAIDLAPNVSSYYSERNSIYATLRSDLKYAGVIDCSGVPGATETQRHENCLSEKLLSGSRAWLDNRQVSLQSRFSTARSALGIGLRTDDAGLVVEALRLYRESAEMVPSSWRGWNQLAEAHILAGQTDMALAALDRALEITVGTERQYRSLRIQAEAHRSAGDTQKALDKLQEAIDLHHRPHEAHNDRGAILLGAGQLQKALADFNVAVRLAPEVGEFYFARATAYYAMTRYKAALLDLDESLRLLPDLTLAYNNRGLVYLSLNELELALQDFNQSIRMEPDNALAYNNQGLVYNRTGQSDLALENFDAAIRLDPQLVIAYSNRALIHSVLGNEVASEKDIAAAVALGVDEQGLREAIDLENNR